MCLFFEFSFLSSVFTFSFKSKVSKLVFVCRWKVVRTSHRTNNKRRWLEVNLLICFSMIKNTILRVKRLETKRRLVSNCNMTNFNGTYSYVTFSLIPSALWSAGTFSGGIESIESSTVSSYVGCSKTASSLLIKLSIC